MQVTVYYLAQLRRAAGGPMERVELAPGSTIQGLYARLGELHGEPFRALVHASLLVFVGDEPAGLGHVLREADQVMILTPMAGGAA
jgi:MoaE-MoaD fusion protein